MGFVFALFYLLIAHPSVHSLLWSLLGTVPGLALRAYASGYVTKNTELTTTGPYAYTRNPLYLGSMLIAFGFAVAAHSWWTALALAILFTLIYWPTIRSEEEFLRGHFSDFAEYCSRVPRLIPRLTPAASVVEKPRSRKWRLFRSALRKTPRVQCDLGLIEYLCRIAAAPVRLAQGIVPGIQMSSFVSGGPR